MSNKGWIGVDLDGTLAHYDGWQGIQHIGEPVPKMMARVRRWLREGREVRIFTARCHEPEAIPHIEKWLLAHDLFDAEQNVLAVTNVKDFAMDELWDDRVVRVEANTGTALCASPRGLDTP